MTNVSRARGCLFGLAVGDALGGPTEGKSREYIEHTWHRVTDFLSEDQSGSDDTEYALFNARLLLHYGPGLGIDVIVDEWLQHVIGSRNNYKGLGFSEMIAIRNLRNGLRPPACGQHVHSWSDGLAMRVAPFGIVCAGDPVHAAKLAGMDGSVTNAGEGIWSGQAVAAGLARAMSGGNVKEIVEAAYSVIPSDSWTRRAIEHAVDIGSKCRNAWESLTPLNENIACGYYHWPDIAPEAVGLSFGIVAAARDNFVDAVLAGVNIGRDADTIAGIAGSILGARLGESAVPDKWVKRIDVARGSCLSIVKGMHIGETASRLAALGETGS